MLKGSINSYLTVNQQFTQINCLSKQLCNKLKVRKIYPRWSFIFKLFKKKENTQNVPRPPNKSYAYVKVKILIVQIDLKEQQEEGA